MNSESIENTDPKFHHSFIDTVLQIKFNKVGEIIWTIID